jgi:hypothetical protein
VFNEDGGRILTQTDTSYCWHARTVPHRKSAGSLLLTGIRFGLDFRFHKLQTRERMGLDLVKRRIQKETVGSRKGYAHDRRDWYFA